MTDNQTSNQQQQNIITQTTDTKAVDTLPKMEKLKVNGKEIEVSIDELKRAYGLHTASEMKFQDAAKMRKEAEELKNVFSNKEINALLKAGWTEDEIEEKAAQFLVERAKLKTMSPEQLEQKKREEEYRQLKKEKEERERLEKEKIEQTRLSKEANRIQKEFLQEIEKENSKTWLDLEDPIILENIVNIMRNSLNKFGYIMTVGEAVKKIEDNAQKKGPHKKEYLRRLLKNNIKELDDNDLDAFLERGGKGVRDKSIEQFKKAEAPFVKHKPQTQSIPAEDKSVVKDVKYYRKLRLGLK